jgi:hypothetical protein
MRLFAKFGVGLLVFVLCAPVFAQVNDPLQTFIDHLAGTWVGSAHRYNLKIPTTSTVTIKITRDKKNPGTLDFDQFSVLEGQTKAEESRSSMTFNPEGKSTVRLDFGSPPDGVWQVEGLDEVLRTGYGTFSLRPHPHRPYVFRFDYHLTPDTLNEEDFISVEGGPFIQNFDTLTKRAPAMP